MISEAVLKQRLANKKSYEKNKAKRKLYYINNKESISARKKERYHRTKTCEDAVVYTKEEKSEAISKRGKAYYLRNRDSILVSVKTYRDKNKELISRKRGSSEGKLRSLVNTANRRAMKKQLSDGTINIQSLSELLISQNNRCYHCEEILEEKHLDHYFPLSKGGLHSINNVVWSCPSCNLKKSATVPLTLF